MLDLMFFLKTFLVSLLFVALLQVEWRSITLEEHIHGFIHTSAFMTPIQSTAQNGVKLIRKGVQWISTEMNKKFPKAKYNWDDLNLKRSSEYEQSIEDKIENKKTQHRVENDEP
ncbi:MAG: hypothetical protein K1X29_07610 [Bdellovibrionales bacterium]|nr:hypothetical protein [Bdellovibrionales bacterium]